MSEDADQISILASQTRAGSVVAAAGCGKTEQIAKAAKISRRRLILTHTHAGVDALRRRLQAHEVSGRNFRLDTIAGWCLKYAASFPTNSALGSAAPEVNEDWDSVYAAASKLMRSGAVSRVLTASYGGVFVDEYQDCSKQQHDVIVALAETLPVCVFGDPLQAIFDFKSQEPVDWDSSVFSSFPKVGELSRPWRWEKNPSLAAWLTKVRVALESGGGIDLSDRPACVDYRWMPSEPGLKQGAILAACKAALSGLSDGKLIVIGDPVNINARALLAQKLAAVGFSNIEPLSCAPLTRTANAIESKTGMARLKAILDFVSRCMTGSAKSEFVSAVQSRLNGRRAGTAKFGSLVQLGVDVVENQSHEAVLALIEAFPDLADTNLFRRELYLAMRAALRLKCSRKDADLGGCIWEVQNRVRHAGRLIGRSSIGSTLLVKGLQFDRSIIIHSDRMTRKDWYVALTRATTKVTVIAPREQITFH
jgi:hypothetical protein